MNAFNDVRPSMWIGHVVLGVPSPEESKRFFLDLGLRDAEPGDGPVGILELRGGTHLILLPSQAPVAPDAEAPFDLMVDDIDAFRAQMEARGHAPGPVETSDFHRGFKLREPGGHVLTVNSTHVTGLPV